MATITISAPGGLDALMQRGAEVARAEAWTEPHAAETLVGLWLSSQVTLGELRHSVAHAPLPGAEKLVPTIDLGAPSSPEYGPFDQAIAGVWGTFARMVPGPEPTGDLTIRIPGDTGAIPWIAATTVVVVGAVYGVAIWQGKQLIEGWLARDAAAKQLAKDSVELDRLAKEHMDREAAAGRQFVLDPVTSVKVQSIIDRQGLLAQRATAGTPKPDSGQPIWPLALAAIAVIGAAVILKQ